MQEFLSHWEAGPESVDFEKVFHAFTKAMEDGLAGKPGSIGMIPSYVSIPEMIPQGKPVIVLDAGGTNFRTSLVSFDQKGKASITSWQKTSMPGIDHEVSFSEFFSLLADQVERLIDKSDHIGFCFSYAAAITPEGDGVPLLFSKEIKASDVIGKPVGKSLLEELGRRGHEVRNKRIAVVNDTVATLLAGAIEADPSTVDGYVGLILGTGTNMAYVERNSHIAKIARKDGAQCINMESGNFDVGGGRLDREIFASTKDPGHYHFEKMVSGAYLGLQCWTLMRHALEEGNLFSAQSREKLCFCERWSTIAVSDFLAHPQTGEIGQALSSMRDRETMLALIRAVVDKAAKLTAAGICAVIVQSERGCDANKPVALNIDGTTYYRTPGLKEAVEHYLGEYLQGKYHRHVKLLHVEDAPTVGAAIAGLGK